MRFKLIFHHAFAMLEFCTICMYYFHKIIKHHLYICLDDKAFILILIVLFDAHSRVRQAEKWL